MEIIQSVMQKIYEAKSTVTVTPESRLRELGINSIEFIQIIVKIETEYDFTTPDELLYKFDGDTTVDDFCKEIKIAFEMKDN